MKPITLKLAGLHSYREIQHVDFESLCEAGLFGIFGPTGSGKSTILDAITLALYGEVVRLGGKTHPKEVLNQLEQRAFVSFTFEIGGQNERKRYTIEREFGLDRKGNRRQPEVRLIECGDGREIPDQVIESKANAATAAIETLIGLTLQDFTRAVVLPQGQFSKFLTLKGSDRNEMLQRMFQLHEYGEKLNDRIRRASEENKREIHRLELELAALGNVGPDAMEAAKAILEKAEEQNKQFSEQKEALTQQKREMEQVYQWQKERAAILQKLELLRAEKAEIEALEKKCKQIEAAKQLWPLLERERAIKIATGEKEELLISQRVEQKLAADAFEEAEKEHLAAQSALRTEEPQLFEQKNKLEQAKMWEQELTALQTDLSRSEQELSTIRQQLEAVTNQIALTEQQLAQSERELLTLDESQQKVTVSPEMRKRLSDLREAKRDWEREAVKQQEIDRDIHSAKQEKQALQEEHQKLTLVWQQVTVERTAVEQAVTALEGKPVAKEEELEKQREELSQVKALGKEWRDQLQIQAEWQNKWSACEQACLESEEKTKTAAGELQRYENQYNQLVVDLDQARNAYHSWQQENLANLLRQELTDGQECPVCGSTHHPFHQNERSNQQVTESSEQSDKLLERVKEQEAALTSADRQVREASDRWQEAKIALAATQQRKSSLTDEQQAIENRIKAIIEQCQLLGDKWNVSTIDELLHSFKEWDAAFRLQLEERTQHATLLEQQQQKFTLLRERELKEQGACETKAALLLQLEEKLTLLQTRGKEASMQAGDALSKLNLLRGEIAVEAIEAEYKRLEDMDKQFEELRQVRMEHETKRKQFLNVWDADKEKRNQIIVKQAALEERFQERKLLYQEKHQRWLAQTDGEPATVLYEQVDARLTHLRDTAMSAQQLLQSTLTARQQAQEQLLKTEEAFVLLSAQHKEAELSLHRSLLQAGFEQLEMLEALYSEREQLADYQQQVQSYTTQYSQLEYDLQRLSQMLDGREVSHENYETLINAWAELEQLSQSAKDEVAVARQTLAQITANHEKWQELQVSLKERSDEQSRLDELKKLFEGKAFVQFIAEEKLIAIARDASYHLNRMTKNRYALEIGDEGEFVLRDEGAGGIRRPVSTLSGGETFLTSLALALALSVEIQMRGGRLEFFFLDEGFGTLDPELLEVVLDALEKLRMDHFTIGVISHVPEIRVRMPRRLIISPAEPLGAGSRIELETE